MAELREVRRGGVRAALVVDVDDGWLVERVESTSTVGRPARRIWSISGWSPDSPMATTPSTVARSIARASEPCSGEMKWRP